MIKVEIIANRAIEEDIIEALEACGYGENFTYLTAVFGRGSHGRREKSATWPEENILFHIEVDDADLEKISREIKQVKEAFPQEGMRCYVHRGIERLL